MPVGVDAKVEIVRVVEQVGVQEADEKEAVVFCGRPETVKEMDREVPATYRAVRVVE